MKCFYHSGDLDGHCSGAIVNTMFPGCEMVGIDYTDAFPWDRVQPSESVWMVDFSLQPFSDMVKLNDACLLTWIDHHKTSIAAADAVGFRARGGQSLAADKAACELAWGAAVGCERPLPRAVLWLGRYDIWKHDEHPGALEFQYGMRFQPDTKPDAAIWKELFTNDEAVFPVCETGKTILRYEEVTNAKYCSACAFEVELDGLHCVAINKALANSLAFKSVYDPTKHDAMLSFYAKRLGLWTISLYADKPHIDVSAICKARGGGGHRGAAGFSCAMLPWETTR